MIVPFAIAQRIANGIVSDGSTIIGNQADEKGAAQISRVAPIFYGVVIAAFYCLNEEVINRLMENANASI